MILIFHYGKNCSPAIRGSADELSPQTQPASPVSHVRGRACFSDVLHGFRLQRRLRLRFPLHPHSDVANPTPAIRFRASSIRTVSTWPRPQTVSAVEGRSRRLQLQRQHQYPGDRIYHRRAPSEARSGTDSRRCRTTSLGSRRATHRSRPSPVRRSIVPSVRFGRPLDRARRQSTRAMPVTDRSCASTCTP